MLEVLSNFICSLIMCITSFLVIKEIINSDEQLNFKNLILIIALTIIQQVIHSTTYNIASVLLIFLINIIFYKLIFKISKEKSITSYGIYLLILFLADGSYSILARNIFTVEQIRTVPIISISSNIIIGTISYTIINIKTIKNKCHQFININNTKTKMANIIFVTLNVVCFVFLGYNITSARTYDLQYIVNISIMLILIIIMYFMVQNKIRYNQLSDEYNTLFGYVQNFEEWIERDQLNRHEYKNQLAVIRSITKDKSVIKKINDLLDDNIKIKGDAVYKLKELPTGGLKGLMYYKVAIAQKQNINIEVDVSLKRKSEFKDLNEHKIKVLSNLIGIYFDNAIEAALETKKKNVCLEVYEIKDGVKFVISNTFKRSENFDRRNERGVTSKGKGHGNGLYYANNLISKNNWLEASQETIDNYYIQNIIIKN